MPPATVAPLLAKRYGQVRAYQDKLGIEYRGTIVFAEAYTTKMTAEKGLERATVLFGTPTTGNGVVEVSVQTDYFDAANGPKLAQVQAELVAKYGVPADSPASPTPNVTTVVWSYTTDKAVPCPHASCRADVSEGLEVPNLGAYNRATRSGHPLIIVASLLSSTENADLAASVVVRVSDAATKARTLEAAIAQMKQAATEAGSESAAERDSHQR
jgi:hypothetical protein